MPSLPLSDARAAELADRLRLARMEAFDASLEVLDHYADVGDPATQLSLDTLTEHAADTMRALAADFDAVLLMVDGAAPPAVGSDGAGRRGSPAQPPRPRRRDLDGFGSAW